MHSGTRAVARPAPQLTVAGTGFGGRVAAQTLMRHVAAHGKPPHVLEGAECLRNEMAFTIADFAFAISHRGRTMQHASGSAQFAAPRLHEVDLHFHRDDTDAVAR